MNSLAKYLLRLHGALKSVDGYQRVRTLFDRPNGSELYAGVGEALDGRGITRVIDHGP